MHLALELNAINDEFLLCAFNELELVFHCKPIRGTVIENNPKQFR